MYIIDTREEFGHYGRYPEPVAKALVSLAHRLARYNPRRVFLGHLDYATYKQAYDL